MAIETQGGAQGYIVTDPERLAQLAQDAIEERKRRMSGVYGGGRISGWDPSGYVRSDEQSVLGEPEGSHPTRVLSQIELFKDTDGDYPHGDEYLAMRREAPAEEAYVPPSGRFWWENPKLTGYYIPPSPYVEQTTVILPVVAAPQKISWQKRIQNFLAAEGKEWKGEFQLWKYHIGRMMSLLKKQEQTAAAPEETPTHRFDGDNNLVPL